MTDESTDTQYSQVAPNDKDAFPVVLRPVWEPFGTEADEVVDRLVKDAFWPSDGPKAIKYRVMVASFLKAVQEVFFRHLHRGNNNNSSVYLGVRRRNEAWSACPLVGKDVGIKVADELCKQFCVMQVEGSGSSNLVQDEQGKWSTDPKMSMYEVDLAKAEQFKTLRFIQTGLPRIKINKAESRRQRDARRAEKKAKLYLNNTKARELFGDLYIASESRIDRLNAHWRHHPLILPDGHSAASATRVYHDDRMDAGGRLYGPWTGLKRDENGIKKRLHCTIEGEPICELDIRASQPTLFSSLLGYRMGGLGKGGTWGDAYAELSSLWAVNIWWADHDPLINKFDLIRRNRKVAKAVVISLIGDGYFLKKKAIDEVKALGLSPSGWVSFRDTLIRTIPALECLEPRYDKNGNLSGYMNGAGFLSYHESEIMMLTLERLMEQGIPAYPVHDCLMVKISDARQAAYTFRDTIRAYCYQMNGLDVLVPLSVETACTTEDVKLPKAEELMGVYLS